MWDDWARNQTFRIWRWRVKIVWRLAETNTMWMWSMAVGRLQLSQSFALFGRTPLTATKMVCTRLVCRFEWGNRIWADTVGQTGAPVSHIKAVYNTKRPSKNIWKKNNAETNFKIRQKSSEEWAAKCWHERNEQWTSQFIITKIVRAIRFFYSFIACARNNQFKVSTILDAADYYAIVHSAIKRQQRQCVSCESWVCDVCVWQTNSKRVIILA